jgi:hypothetical protein
VTTEPTKPAMVEVDRALTLPPQVAANQGRGD